MFPGKKSNPQITAYLAGFLILIGILSRSPFLVIIGGLIGFSAVKQLGGLSSLFSKFNFQSNIKKPISMNDNIPTFNPKKGKQIIAWAVAVAVVLLLLIKSIVIIPSGNTGVTDLFGKVKDKEVSSGIHLINPLLSITKMSIRTEEYTMSITSGEGTRQGDDSIGALTSEGLSIDLDITVLFRLVEDKASDVFRELGLNYNEKIVRPKIRSSIREVVAEYSSKDIYSEKRQEAAQSILDRLKISLDGRGILVEEVLLRNVSLPERVEQSIEAKLQAEQESQRYDFVLEKESKEADRKRIEAEGQRDAQRTINESLTPRYLEYLYIQELKDREGTIYVPTSPSNGLPLFRGIQ